MGNFSDTLRLATGAVEVLLTADADRKAVAARALARAWHERTLERWSSEVPPLPARPARPARPELRPPREMPRRKGSGGRAALLHALAHIELNAIDLACDMIARFGRSAGFGLPFLEDWIGVADDEARHFQMLQERLASRGMGYGGLPAHDGLWQAAQATAEDLMGRLAVVPMVLEARGLDVTPAMIRQFKGADDQETAAVLRRIHDDEIRHVAVGCRWFLALCAQRRLDPATTWQAQVRRFFKGPIKPPFNTESRSKAGLPPDFYEPLADRPGE